MKSMDTTHLKKFDLHFPGIRIEGVDCDGVSRVLSHVENLFVEAVASYALFRPLTHEGFKEYRERQSSRYESCLNGLYSKAFVFALHGIQSLIKHLCDKSMHPPEGVQILYDKYKSIFGHLKHIRDSAIHIEDRGRGVTRNQKSIATHILVIGDFSNNRFGFTGEDGKVYQVEISEETLEAARRCIQGVIDCYDWRGPGLLRPEKWEKGLTTE